jgi:hypothetical protein
MLGRKALPDGPGLREIVEETIELYNQDKKPLSPQQQANKMLRIA